jgi:hypothetical protein
VNHAVIDMPEVIVTDKNAAKDYVRFYPAPNGLQALNKDLVFAQFWLNRDDPFDEQYRRGVKCAEVLVPDSVAPDLLIGAYVANQLALTVFQKLGTRLPVAINGSMFF